MGGTVRRDVDADELHVPVVQLPRPPGARPFYDLIANIAAEEYGHIELVAAAINTMLTGATPTDAQGARRPCRGQGVRNPSSSSPAARARCRRTRWAGRGTATTCSPRRRPRRGPDAQLLPRDRRAQQQAEGLRDGRPPRRAGPHRLPARARRRPPGRVRARGREAHGRRPDEAVPGTADPDRQDPRVPAAHRARRAPEALPLLARTTTRRSSRSSPARTRRRARTSRSSTTRPRACRRTTCRRSRTCSRRTTRPRRSPRSRASCARRPGWPSRPASPATAARRRSARPRQRPETARMRPPARLGGPSSTAGRRGRRAEASRCVGAASLEPGA